MGRIEKPVFNACTIQLCLDAYSFANNWSSKKKIEKSVDTSIHY